MPTENYKYKDVKKIFGWKSNFPVWDAVKKGTLERVRVNLSRNGLRITRASVEKLQADLAEQKITQQEFDIKPGQWAAWKQAKAFEDAAKAQAAVDQSRVIQTIQVGDIGEFPVPVPKVYTEPGDQFIPDETWSEDPLGQFLVPPGCFVDETEGIVCGLPTPREAAMIFHARCKARGISPRKILFKACLMDGAGHWRVNDMPAEQQSRPTLLYTPPMGTKGGV